jgi:hypothetical protein
VSDTRSRLRRFLAAAIALLAIGLVAGCSDDSNDDSDADTAQETPSETPSEAASTATDPATDPNGPFVVAATAVAKRSLDQVLQLHVLGTGTVELNSLRDQIPALAGAIHTELGQQVADATMMTPPKGSAAARLVAALNDFRGLAGQLSEWRADGGRPMPDPWFARLERADRDWKGALRELSELSGEDLLANVPELILPA